MVRKRKAWPSTRKSSPSSPLIEQLLQRPFSFSCQSLPKRRMEIFRARMERPSGRKTDKIPMASLLHGETPDKPIRLTFEGQAIGAFVSAGPDAGTLEFVIDGKRKGSVDLYHRYSKGLHYPRSVMFAHDLPPALTKSSSPSNPGIEPQSAFSNSVSIDHPSQSNIILMNPFLDGSFHVPWSKLTPERVVPDMTLALEKAESDIQAIRSLYTGKEINFRASPCGSAKLRKIWGKPELGFHLDQVRNSGGTARSLQRNAPQCNRLWNQGSARPNPLETSQVLRSIGRSAIPRRSGKEVARRTGGGFRGSGSQSPGRQKNATRETVHRTCPGYPKVLREFLIRPMLQKNIGDESLLEGLKKLKS